MKLTFKHTKYACYTAYISTAIANNLPSLLFFTFQSKFGITNHQLALLVTLNFVTQMTMDILGTKYVDKIGYRPLLITAFSCTVTGLATMSILPFILPVYLGLCISSVIYAIGGGLAEVMISPMIEALPGDEKASAMSILHSFYCWGQVAVVALSALFFATVGGTYWYLLPLLWAIVPCITIVMFAKVPIRTLNDDKPTLPIHKLLGMRFIWLMILLMICSGAAELAAAQWSSLFAESALGVSKALGDLLGPCFFAVCMGISRVIYGKAGEKLPMIPALCISAAICTGGYTVMFAAQNPYLSLAGCGLVGLGVGLFWPGVLSLSAGKLPLGGTPMFGILAISGDLGCIVGPELTAIVSSVKGLDLRDGLFAAAVFPLIILIITAAFLISDKTVSKKKPEENSDRQ